MPSATLEADRLLAASLGTDLGMWMQEEQLAITSLRGWYPWDTVLATTDKTALLRVQNQLATTDKTALLHVLGIVGKPLPGPPIQTSDMTALLWVRGSEATTDKTAYVMVNGVGTGIGTLNRVWFYYPFEVATSELGIRNPIFGNAIEQDPLIVARLSRGGTYNRFHRAPQVRRLVLQFRHLSEDMGDALRTFFNTVRSSAMRYVDHEGTTWKAWLTADALRQLQATRAATEHFDLALDVETP